MKMNKQRMNSHKGNKIMIEDDTMIIWMNNYY